MQKMLFNYSKEREIALLSVELSFVEKGRRGLEITISYKENKIKFWVEVNSSEILSVKGEKSLFIKVKNYLDGDIESWLDEVDLVEEVESNFQNS